MEYLRYQIAREIGVTQDWPVVIVGIGNLGHALANYSGFSSRGFRIVALLDADPRAARRATSAASASAPSTSSRTSSSEHGVAIGVIATPAAAAQDVCDRLVAAGVTSILNFAPAVLSVPDGRRRTQGRPVHRAADPRLPRAAQGARGRARELDGAVGA